MKRDELEFDSRDNRTKLYAVCYLPDDGEVKAVLQVIHGMAEYVERYAELAQFLTDRGFAVVGEDHLGHGGSIGKGIPGYFCKQDPATVVVRDAHRLKKIVQQQYPGVPYIILGHSMGSFILRNYLVRYGTGIQGAVIMGTGVQPPLLLSAAQLIAKLSGTLLGEKRKGRLLHKMAFGSYNKRIRDARTDVDWLSVNRQNVDQYLKDPMCGFVFTRNGFATLFELIRRCQIRENLQNIPKELPILIVSGEEDPVGGYGKGVRKVASQLQSAGLQQVACKLYPGLRHEILNETSRETVREELYDWFCKQVL